MGGSHTRSGHRSAAAECLAQACVASRLRNRAVRCWLVVAAVTVVIFVDGIELIAARRLKPREEYRGCESIPLGELVECEYRWQRPYLQDLQQPPPPLPQNDDTRPPWLSDHIAASAPAVPPHTGTRWATNVVPCVPGAQRWGQCRHCAVVDGHLLLFDAVAPPTRVLPMDATGTTRRLDASDAEDTVLLSQSLWHEFFHAQTDTVVGHIVHVPPFAPPVSRQWTTVVKTNVYIVPMIGLHVGHLYVDVLCQLYHVLRRDGVIPHPTEWVHAPPDTWRSRVVLGLESANQQESPVLLEKILTQVYEEDNPFRLLRCFTDNAIHTRRALMAAGTRDDGAQDTMFEHLTLGVDASDSISELGYAHHPHVLDLSEPEVAHARNRHNEFRQFLSQCMAEERIGLTNAGGGPSEARGDDLHGTKEEVVLFIDRQASRVVLNREELVHAASEVLAEKAEETTEPRAWAISRTDLDDAPFSHHVSSLQRAGVVVAAFGTGAHNVLFMKPGSVLVLLAQPDWCDWKWMYANEAILLGVHVLVYCHDDATQPGATSAYANLEGHGDTGDGTGEPTVRRWRWSPQAWLQGPFFGKEANFTVDPSMFADMMAEALQLRGWYLPGQQHQQQQNQPPLEPRIQTFVGPAFPLSQQQLLEIAPFGTRQQRQQAQHPIRVHFGEMHVSLHHQWCAGEPVPQSISSSVGWDCLTTAALIATHYVNEAPQQLEQQQQQHQQQSQVAEGNQDAVLRSVNAGRSFLREPVPIAGALADQVLEAQPPYATIAFVPEIETSIPAERLFHEIEGVSVCVSGSAMSPTAEEVTACFSMEQFDYHANITMQMMQRPYQVPWILRTWLASCSGTPPSSTAGGGTQDPNKCRPFEGSVSYTAIDPAIATLPPYLALRDAVDRFVDTRGDRMFHRQDMQTRDLAPRINLALPLVAHAASCVEAFVRPSLFTTPYVCVDHLPPNAWESLSVDMLGRTSLQQAVADFVSQHDLTGDAATAAVLVAQRQAAHELQRLAYNLPPRQLTPTPENPFVFVHLEKTGGSTFRHLLANAAVEHGVPLETIFAPCEYPKECWLFDPPSVEEAPELSVLAVHAQWNYWLRPGIDETMVQPSCFLVSRHPLDRIASLYYTRAYVGFGKDINDLSDEELEDYIEFRDGHQYSEMHADDGIKNSLCKILTGDRETMRGKLVGEPVTLPSCNCTLAKLRLQQCVVGVQESWQATVQVLNHWFPWLQINSVSAQYVRTRPFGREDYSDRVRAAIEAVNQCDLELHRLAEDQLLRELAVARMGTMQPPLEGLHEVLLPTVLPRKQDQTPSQK